MNEEQVLELMAEYRSLCRRLKAAIDAGHPAARSKLTPLLKTCLTKVENARDLVDRVLLVSRKQAGGAGGAAVPAVLVRWKDRLAGSLDEAQTHAAAILGTGSTSSPTTTSPTTPTATPVSSSALLEAATLAADCHAACAGATRMSVPPSHTPFSWTVPPSAAIPPSHTAFSLGVAPPTCHSTRIAALRSITASIRALEQSMDFQRDLVADVMSVTGRSDVTYSRDNFAFGGTPFQTWKALFSLPMVRDALTVCRSDSTPPTTTTTTAAATAVDPRSVPHTAVLGSSHGLLAFNAVLAAGVRSVGYELLPTLVRHASALQAQHAIPSSDLVFVEGDMLRTADLTHCRLALLTSQCWDPTLCAAVYAKLESEAPSGCVVIDYLSGLQTASASFHLAATHSAPVSWGDSLKFHIYTKN